MNCSKYHKSKFKQDLLKGRLRLIEIEQASMHGIVEGKNKLKGMHVSSWMDNGTKINGAENNGRDLIFYDCRGEAYDLYLYCKRFKCDVFINGEFILVVNFDRVDFRSKLFFFRKINKSA